MSLSTPVKPNNLGKRRSPQLTKPETKLIKAAYNYLRSIDEYGADENSQVCFLSTGKRNVRQTIHVKQY